MAGLRRLLVASVAAAGLAGALAQSSNMPSESLLRRKTMGFGPAHPHAVFVTGDTVPTYNFQSLGADSCPFKVAMQFARELTDTRLAPGSDFYVREDSYTDKNTGVTHVYLRQTVHGIEVSDGDMNINVKDGRVLSYGDSVSDDASRVIQYSDTIPVLPWLDRRVQETRRPRRSLPEFGRGDSE